MTINFKPCWICVGISGLWLGMSAGVAWGLVPPPALMLPIGILMGGSIVGIAYQRNSLRWKITVIALGMPVAFLLLNNLSKTVVIIELIMLLILAYVLFAKRGEEGDKSKRVEDLEEKLKQCC